MNTPYPELLIDTDDLRDLYANWNARNGATRREYEGVEFAACLQPGCTRLSPTKTRGNCRHCADEKAKSAKRATIQRGGKP